MMFDLEKALQSANTIRMLSAEAIQKAKSGHPGMPLGCADFAFTLWYKYMRHNPKNPNWLGRDVPHLGRPGRLLRTAQRPV